MREAPQGLHLDLAAVAGRMTRMITLVLLVVLSHCGGHQFTKLSAMNTFLRTSYPTDAGVGIGCCGLTGGSVDGAP